MKSTYDGWQVFENTLEVMSDSSVGLERREILDWILRMHSQEGRNESS
jgi:hypothetical protein